MHTQRILLFLVALQMAAPLQAAEEKLIYNRDIRPILSDKCFFCHGPDPKTREADLRLDEPEAAYAENDGVIAIVPGNTKKSELVFRIFTDDADELMPPAKAHKELSDEEKALLKRWVAEGAEYQDHWAFVKPERPEIPKLSRKSPAHNAIDNLVQSELKEQNRKPSPEADRRTLIRRLALDLTGLPPTYDEVETFVNDRSRKAYSKVVDHYMSSSHFGERLAIKWLDLVRYADSSGYHSDISLSNSPYRDYVIKAFNDNMSYDRFTREQLAGDLLKEPTRDQKVASAYNRMNMTTDEGGAQAKEYLAKYMTDRVNNLSAVWMGATVGCAECHDHKFDPYTSKDFYSMGAFFADIKEPGQYGTRGFSKKRDPIITILSPEKEKEQEELLSERTRLEAFVSRNHPETGKAFQKWMADQEKMYAQNTMPVRKREDIALVDDGPLQKAKFETPVTTVKKGDVGVQVYKGNTARHQKAEGLVQHILNMHAQTRIITEEDRVYAMVWLDPENPPSSVMLQVQKNKKDWEHRVYWGADTIPYGKTSKSKAAYHKKGPLPETGKWIRLEATMKELGMAPNSSMSSFAFTQFGGNVFWDEAGVTAYPGGANLDKIKTLIALDKQDDKRDGKLFEVFVSLDKDLQGKRKETEAVIKKLEALYKEGVTVPISVPVQPRDIRILARGNWMDDSGELVEPAIPAFLGKLETGEKRATRLDLANWLMNEENPFTARVMMNNLWQMYFGRAISTVQDDLGNQGAWPDNSALLDWLAVEFMESGWDIKHMIRAMVTSHTYRQSSASTKNDREWDPYNKHLARQAAFRMDAELVRDNVLKMSGLLVPTIGGESVKPYQPAGYYKELNFPKRKYQPSKGENQYRRGLYTHWQRTFTHPSMVAFDAPSRESCTARRSRSNTPLQALVVMNDPTYVEAARVFAKRILSEGGSSREERLKWACHQVLLRDPDAITTKVLSGVYASHLAEYKADMDAAKALAGVGDSAAPEGVDTSELAAWTSVSRVLFNLHETVTRN